MLRWMYQGILHLHPHNFRARFGEEMLSIFDQSESRSIRGRLLADGLASLLRQWILRSEFRRSNRAQALALPGGDGIPGFYTFAPFKPRGGALIQGAVLSFAIFCAVCFIMKYGVNHPVYMPFVGVVTEENPQTERLVNAIPSSEDAIAPLGVTGRMSTFLPIDRERLNSKLRQLIPNSGKTLGPDQKLHAAGVPVRPGTTKIPERLPGNGGQAAASASINPLVAAVPEWMLRSYVGVYIVKATGQIEVSVSLEEGQLYIAVRGEPKSPLIPMSENRFTPSGGSDLWIEFSPPDGNTPERMDIHSGQYQVAAYRR